MDVQYTTAKPNFFIVGAPKSGTTAMHRYLRAHPDVFMPQHKEPNFFASDFSGPLYEKFPRMEDYLALFKPVQAETAIGEASVNYMYSQAAPLAIKEFAPQAKIIFMLRHPVEMGYAYYYQLIYGGEEDIPSFEEALAAENDRREGRRIPPRRRGPVESLFYRDVMNYAKAVQRYLDVFGPDAVHVIIFDDFQRDTAAIYRGVLEFLGVDPSFTPLFERVNVSKRMRIKFLQDYLRTPPSRGLWLRKVIQGVVPATARRALAQRLRRLNSRELPRPPLDPALRQRLIEDIQPEIDQLSAAIGRDLSHWCASVQ